MSETVILQKVEGTVPHRSTIKVILSFCMPLLIMSLGYAISKLIPWIWPWMKELSIWPWVALQLAITGGWLGREGWYMANRVTSGNQLLVELIGDMILALCLTAYFFNHVVTSWDLLWIQWWYIVPFLGAIVDEFLSAVLGINNALQKPGLQPLRGSA
jgi:hypothetical protein